MTYVMSDVHGYYDSYLEFLRYVNFSGADRLYIIGDLIDRGSDGIRLLQDVMARENVHCVLGNHEQMNLPVLQELCGLRSQEACRRIIEEELAISDIGQEDTLADFCRLSPREQWEMLSYLQSLPLFLELQVNAQEYLLVHGGLPDFDQLTHLESYTEDELLFGPHDFSIRHFADTVILVGHLPTRFISGAEPDAIFWSQDSVGLDCGLGFGGRLGVLCLESGEELCF